MPADKKRKVVSDPNIRTNINFIKVNIYKISRNLLELNLSLCRIIPQSFSYFGCFVLMLCCLKYAPKWVQKHWKQTCRYHTKI